MRLITYLMAFGCAVANFSANAQTKIGGYKYQIIDSGQLSIPIAKEICHGSTVVPINKDSLLFAWFLGDYEGAKNVKIYGVYYNASAKKLGYPFVLASAVDSSGQGLACWNPVLYYAPNGNLVLDYKIGPNPREWWAVRKISTDKSLHWSESETLPSQFLGPIRNKPFVLDKKHLLFPSSMESRDQKYWRLHLELADKKANPMRIISIDNNGFNAIQPTILRYSPKKLQLLARSKENIIVQSWSQDNGKHWSKLTATKMPNPNSGIDAVTLHNGWQILVYNPAVSGKDWWEGRAVLKVAVSQNGEDWQDVCTLEQHTKGEYSYPAIIQDQNGNVQITYTNDRKNIKFVTIKIEP